MEEIPWKEVRFERKKKFTIISNRMDTNKKGEI